MNAAYATLLPRVHELRDLSGVIGLATWDQETYLPPSGEPARAAQLATLQGLYHERLVDPALGALLDEASAATLGSDERALLRVLRWERDRAVKVPQALVRALAETQSRALSAWREARARFDFRVFQPALEQLIEIRREQADALGHDGERYDALLEAYEPGMRVSRLKPVLEALRAKLVPLLQRISERKVQGSDPFAGKRFDPDRQWTFTLELLEAMGFDFKAGRQDRSIHPFTGGTHPLDVRLTVRLDPANPLPAIFGAIHEGGHGLYEQGYAPEHHRTPLAAAPSMGLHESQSRLWENIVGRSPAFWRHFYPRLQKAFPAELGDVAHSDFLAAVNRVEKSLIRTEADECTYNLHIVLRFELELLLLRGDLRAADLPAAWDDRMESLLGIRPTDPVTGVLQDIHWAWGEFGYFPTYALGNLYAASLFGTVRRELPSLDQQLARGELLPLRDWLRERIHREGYRVPAEELVRQVTGRGLTDADFLQYLEAKYLP